MSKRSALDSPTDSPARDAGKSRGAGWPRDDRPDDGRWADRGDAPRTGMPIRGAGRSGRWRSA